MSNTPKNIKTDSPFIEAPVYYAAETSSNAKYFSISHTPSISLRTDNPIEIKIKIKGTSAVKWVRLCYRSVNQDLKYSKLFMMPAEEEDTYSAILPVSKIDVAYDLMYFIEMVDSNGKGFIYPDFNKEMPYIISRFER